MAKRNSNLTQSKTAVRDYTVPRVMTALVLAILSIIVLRFLRHHYTNPDQFYPIYTVVRICTVFFAALAVAAAVLLLLRKGGAWKKALPHILAISILYTVTGILLWTRLIDYLWLLYTLHIAAFALYIIYELYRTEFLAVSFVTVAAGLLFFRFSQSTGFGRSCIALAVLLVLSAAFWIVLAAAAASRKGKLRIGSKTFRIFPAQFSPILIYTTCAIWLACFAVCLLLGPGFAYYCIFAAVAYELLAAVYYTFQLK